MQSLTSEEMKLLTKFGFVMKDEGIIHKKLAVQMPVQKFQAMTTSQEQEEYIKELLRTS